MKRLPDAGLDWATIESRLTEAKADDYDWRSGRVPYYIYYLDDELLEVQRKAYSLYMVENALSSRGAFPSLGRLQDEVTEMGLGLFNGGAAAGATFTSGGTESVFQAIKTARDKALAERAHITRPNLVAPYTRHASVSKAAHILSIDQRTVPVAEDGRADVAAMRDAMDDQTILLYSSAPCFFYGVFDPIAELGRLALEKSVWLHVDGCWGGFISPFAKRLGYAIPDFDLSVPGVSSLSADLHKFGFGCKGASLLMFSDKADQQYERYVVSDVASGPYMTPSFPGSKPGGAISAAWAVMHYLGEEGYVDAVRLIMGTTMRFIEGINEIDGLRVFEPTGEANLFRYTSEDTALNIYAVARLMGERSWLIGQHRTPPAIHQAINPVHAQAVEPYLADLREVVSIVRNQGLTDEFRERTY